MTQNKLTGFLSTFLTLAIVSLSSLNAYAQDCTTFNAPPRQPGVQGLAGLTNQQIEGLLNNVDTSAPPYKMNGGIAGLDGMLVTDVAALNDAFGTLQKTNNLGVDQVGEVLKGVNPTALKAFKDGKGTELSHVQINNLLQNASNLPGISTMDIPTVATFFDKATTGHFTDAEILKAFPGYNINEIRDTMKGGLGSLGAFPSFSADSTLFGGSKPTFNQISSVFNAVGSNAAVKDLYTGKFGGSIDGVIGGIKAISAMDGLQGMTGSQITNAIKSVDNFLNLPDIKAQIAKSVPNAQIAIMAGEIPGMYDLLSKLKSTNPNGTTVSSQTDALDALLANPYGFSNVMQSLSNMSGLQGLSSKQIEAALNSFNKIKTLPGLSTMGMSGITNIYQSFAGLQQLNGLNISQIGSSLSQVNTSLSGIGGFDAITAQFAAIKPQPNLQQIESVLKTLGGTSGFDPGAITVTIGTMTDNGVGLNDLMSAFPAGMSPQSVTGIFKNFESVGASLKITNMKDTVGALQGMVHTDPNKLVGIFNGLPLEGAGGIKEILTDPTKLGGLADVSKLGGISVTNITGVLGSAGGVKDLLRGADINQISGVLSGIGGISGTAGFNNILNSVTGIANVKGLEGLGGLSNANLSSLFTGMSSITQQGLQGLGVGQISSVFQGIEALQNLSQIGGLNTIMGSLGSLNPADLGSIMSSFPQLQGVMKGLPEIGKAISGINVGNIAGLNGAGVGVSGPLTGLNLGALSGVGAGAGVFDSVKSMQVMDGVSDAVGQIASSLPFTCPLPIESLGTVGQMTSKITGGSFLSSSPDSSTNPNALRGVNIEGIKPNGCLVAKSTPRESFLSGHYSSWLFRDATIYRDYNQQASALSLYRGLGNQYSDKSDMTSLGMSKETKKAFGGKTLGCQFMFDMAKKTDPKKPLTPKEARYVLDNCANQYILNNAYLNTTIPFVDVGGFSKNLSPALCQQLTPIPYGESDYDLKKYLDKSWNKAMKNPNLYPGMKIVPADDKDKPELTKNANINSILTGVERIYDPTHPFSPRQYYSGTERQTFSPMTASYGQVGPCTVACSAVPVDLLEWRKAKFTQCIVKRIAVNAACLSNYWCRLAVGKKPPCSTRFDKKDRVGFMCRWAGDIKKCCHELAKPVASMNALKLMKNDGHRPEGYVFKEYFGDHRPYMRWWDTGSEAGDTGVSTPNYYSKRGSKDAIVGVGNERHSCKYGGTGSGTSPLLSWTETKLYQARTFRDYSLNCLGNYEKLYKWGAAEDFALSRAGAEYSQVVSRETMTSTVNRQFPLGWRGYVSDPVLSQRFPYMFTKGTTKGAMLTGLDNAQPGDILIYDEQVFDPAKKRLPLVAYVTETNNKRSYRRTDPATGADVFEPVVGPNFVRVMDYNHGKYPDVCGVTDSWGISQERSIYKEDSADKCKGLPCEVYKLFEHRKKEEKDLEVAPQMYCEDPDLAHCLEDRWSHVKIYRPTLDVR